MEKTQKENVHEFNSDVEDNGGYRYTQNAPFSSIVSNRRITEETAKVIKSITPLKSVVDIGCGDGTYTSELKKGFGLLEFTGFDPADVAIKIAKERYPECQFLVGDILNTDTFPAKKYDLSIIRGVIHHLPTQYEAIKNASILSDRILIIEPNGNNPILKWIEKKSEYHLKHEEQSFSSDFLKKICLDNGFRIKTLSFIGYVPFFFPTIPAKIIYFFQPILEKIPLLAKYFGAQTVILAEK